MSYSIALLSAANDGCRSWGGTVLVKFFNDGDWHSGWLIGIGSKMSIQLADTGELVEDVEAHQVAAADVKARA